MLKAEKAWAWQTPRTLCWEELWLLMLLCDRLPGILLLPATRNRVAFSGSRMSPASNSFCHARKNKKLPSFNILPVLLIQWAFVQQSSSHQSPVPNIEHTCRCQAVTTVREPFSPQFPLFAKGREINEECLLCNVESWESLSLADTSDLVLGRALVADAAVWQASRNPIATSYQESRCLFRVENEPSIKQLLPCSENKKLPSFNILPVLLIQWAFVQQSSSHQSPVPNIEHTCRCQAVTTVRKPFSPQFPFLQRVRSMKSVSFAMLKAEKAWAWQTPRTLCWEELWLLMLLCDRIPGILLLPATRNRVAFSGSRMSPASNSFCHARRTKSCPRSISCQCC